MNSSGSKTETIDPIDDEIDYYRLLGVSHQATTDEITRAYRKAMKRTHPDHQGPGGRPAAEERAKLLNQAFTVLSKPDNRRSYDAKIRARTVQDQIMNRYVSGFTNSGNNDPQNDPFASHLRRHPTIAEHRERVQSDRKAIFHLLVLFVFIMLVFVGVLLVWSAASALISLLF